MNRIWMVLLLVLPICSCTSNQLLRVPVDVTVGQQLIDLKKAHSAGVLSDREFDEQKRQLIRNVK